MFRRNRGNDDLQPTPATNRPHRDYGNIFHNLGPNGAGGGNCAICQSTIESTDEVLRHAGCNNNFHVDCLNQWIDQRQSQRRTPTCPVCRGEFTRGRSEADDRQHGRPGHRNPPQTDAGHHDRPARTWSSARSDSWASDDYRAWQAESDNDSSDRVTEALQRVVDRIARENEQEIRDTVSRFYYTIGDMVENESRWIQSYERDPQRAADELETYHDALLTRAKESLLHSLNRFIDRSRRDPSSRRW